MKQTALFEMEAAPKPVQKWCSDDWETPDEVARFMASLVRPDEKMIIEPAAGTGAIAQYLPHSTTCIELNPLRCEVGRSQNPCQMWWDTSYLTFAELYIGLYADLIIGNPPFSIACDFLQASVRIMSPDSRVLFLLPTEFFQSQARAAALRETGLVITKQWQIAGRVGFIKEGEVCNQRQCCDSIVELRLSGKPAVEIVDPYGKL